MKPKENSRYESRESEGSRVVIRSQGSVSRSENLLENSAAGVWRVHLSRFSFIRARVKPEPSPVKYGNDRRRRNTQATGQK